MEEVREKVIAEKLKLESSRRGGADWFFWIAGLSLINSIVFLTGKQWNFVIGLGITQVIDAIAIELSKDLGSFVKVIAFFFDVVAASIFIIFGILARKRYAWAFIVGMIIYAIDGLLFLLGMDLLSIGFHVFALICIYSGYKATCKMKEQAPPAPIPEQGGENG